MDHGDGEREHKEKEFAHEDPEKVQEKIREHTGEKELASLVAIQEHYEKLGKSSIELVEQKRVAEQKFEQKSHEPAPEAPNSQIDAVDRKEENPVALQEAAQLEQKVNEEHQRLGLNDMKTKHNTLAKFFGAAGLGIMVGIAALIYQIVHDKKKDEDAGSNTPNDPFSQLPVDVQEKIKTWNSLSSKDFWNKIADFVEDPATNCTLATQVYFMNFTIDLFGGASEVNDYWLWPSVTEQITVMNDFYAIAKADGKIDMPKMYRAAVDKKYRNRQTDSDEYLPKATAAILFRMVLVKLMNPN